MENYFVKLNTIDVNQHTEKKGNLTYLSWAWAWAEVKKIHPEANYTIYENENGWFYHTDGRSAWVKTGVTVNGIEHIEMLPVMDYKNRAIPLENITSTDVNRAIQRSLTKACARHGLGLYIYAGEDLPEDKAKQANEEMLARITRETPTCKKCGKEIKGGKGQDGKTYNAQEVADKLGGLCRECYNNERV